jgi:hypothetical protein
MTDGERTTLAEQLFALVFGLRPGNDQAGQAWVLMVTSTALARAILASVGPSGDPAELLEVSRQQVAKIVKETQTKFYRDRLTGGNGEPRSHV